MRIQYEVIGAPEVAERVEGTYTRMYVAAAKEMAVQMLELRNYAVTNTMHGQMVNQRTGNLVRNVMNETEEIPEAIVGRVGIPLANTAPYARILHDGGTTRAHVIEAKNAQTLAFQMGGRMIFRKMVNHPGSKFHARPYLKVALDAMKAEIRASLARAMESAL